MQINSKALEGIITDIATDQAQAHSGIALGKSAIAARVAVELQIKWPDAPSSSIWNIATKSADLAVAGLAREVEVWAGADGAEELTATTLAKADSQASLAALIVDQCVSARAGYETQIKRERDFISTEPALNK